MSKGRLRPAGPTIPDNEFIKTTIVLRRQKTGGASQKDVDLVYAFLAQNHISVVEGSTPEKTLATRLIQVGATLRDYRAAGIDPGTLCWVKQRGITHRARQGALAFPRRCKKFCLAGAASIADRLRSHIRVFFGRQSNAAQRSQQQKKT